MLVGANQSFTPEPHFLVESLRAQTRFHDPLGDSLFSHASTAEGFRAWSHNSSGRSSPTESSFPPGSTAVPSPAGLPVPTLLVRSSRPIAPPPNRDAPVGQTLFNQHTSKKVSDDCYEMYIPSLVTPRAADAQGNWRRIRYAILEVRLPVARRAVGSGSAVGSSTGLEQYGHDWYAAWNARILSSAQSQIGLGLTLHVYQWTSSGLLSTRIATEIELNYHLFDAFVVLHGTDTMCYSSSALSFLLEDLGKTVVSSRQPRLGGYIETHLDHHRCPDSSSTAQERCSRQFPGCNFACWPVHHSRSAHNRSDALYALTCS